MKQEQVRMEHSGKKKGNSEVKNTTDKISERFKGWKKKDLPENTSKKTRDMKMKGEKNQQIHPWGLTSEQSGPGGRNRGKTHAKAHDSRRCLRETHRSRRWAPDACSSHWRALLSSWDFTLGNNHRETRKKALSGPQYEHSLSGSYWKWSPQVSD